MEKVTADYQAIDKRNCFQRTFSEMTPGSVRGCIFTLCSCIIGAGALSLPFALAQCGLILGTAILLINGVGFLVYYILTMYCCARQGVFDYVQMVAEQYGEFFRRMTEIALMIMGFGTIATYMVLVGRFFSSVAVSAGIISDLDFDREMARIVIIIGFDLVIWFPLTIPKQITALRYGSLLSVVGMAYIILVVIVQAPSYIASKPDLMSEIDLVKFDQTFLDCMGITYFAYSGSPVICNVCSELKNKTVKRLNKVIIRAFMILMTIYLLMALIGYLSYTNKVPELVVFRPVLNGTEAQDWPMVAGRICVGLYLTLAIPMFVNPTRRGVEQFLYGTTPNFNQLRFYIINIVILVFTAIVAVIVPNILAYFKIFGGLFCTYFSFVMPAAWFYKLEDWNGAVKATVIAFAIIFTSIGLVVTVNTFVGF